jgi:plastocyanin
MKTFLLSTAFAILTAVAFSTTITITNSGDTFTPNTVTIQIGDTVNFQLTSMHNALEVSEATWNAKGITPLPGFEVNFGGGMVTGLTAGTHYFVCTPHATLDMKGKIIVNPATGISNLIPSVDHISVYPNPTSGKFVVQYQRSATQNVKETTSMIICNLAGESLYAIPILTEKTPVDLSLFPTGTYFVRINDNEKMYTKSFVKQ